MLAKITGFKVYALHVYIYTTAGGASCVHFHHLFRGVLWPWLVCGGVLLATQSKRSNLVCVFRVIMIQPAHEIHTYLDKYSLSSLSPEPPLHPLLPVGALDSKPGVSAGAYQS